MLKRRGKIARGLMVITDAVPSIAGFTRGLWASESGRKWMTPLVFFLCLTGLVLVLAATVEAVAPFIYSIF
jgi:hypothetical protein